MASSPGLPDLCGSVKVGQPMSLIWSHPDFGDHQITQTVLKLMAKGGETPPRQVSRQLGGAHWATWVLVGPEKAGGRQNWFNVGQWVQCEVCAVCRHAWCGHVFWAGSVGNYLLCFAGREESGACLAVQY